MDNQVNKVASVQQVFSKSVKILTAKGHVYHGGHFYKYKDILLAKMYRRSIDVLNV